MARRRGKKPMQVNIVKPRRKRSAVAKVKLNRAVVPQSKLIKLKYCEILELDPSSGTPAYDVMRATSINDPYYGTGGHSARGHDQLALLYRDYTVVSSSCKVRFLPTQVGDGGPAIVSLEVRSTGTGTTDIYDLVEQSKAKWTVASAYQMKTLTATYTPKFLDRDSNDTELRSAFNANPLVNAYFHIQVSSDHVSVNSYPVRAIVEIVYVCKCSDPLQLTQS